MKIIENKIQTRIPEYPKNVKCSECRSVVQLENVSDTRMGNYIYSQRESDYVRGFDCPCCKQFSKL